MSDNANQTISRTGSENSGNGGHFDQGGRRNNQSGNRNNNRRRRPSQQIGGEQSANHSQRPQTDRAGAPAQQSAPHNAPQNAAQNAPLNAQGTQGVQGTQSGQKQNPARQDAYQQRRNTNRPQRPNPNAGPITAPSGNVPGSNSAVSNNQQNVRGGSDKAVQNNEKQNSTVRSERTDNQAFGNRRNNPNPQPKADRPREPRTFGRNIRTEETHEDIHRENERIEKEIWLEIASIHTYKLD